MKPFTIVLRHEAYPPFDIEGNRKWLLEALVAFTAEPISCRPDMGRGCYLITIGDRPVVSVDWDERRTMLDLVMGVTGWVQATVDHSMWIRMVISASAPWVEVMDVELVRADTYRIMILFDSGRAGGLGKKTEIRAKGKVQLNTLILEFLADCQELAGI